MRAAAIALHGMYRGVAKLVGMEVLDVDGDTLEDEFTALEKHWKDFDFFYLHVKKTDTAGESGDFAGKVRAIEEVDALLPRLMTLNPDVVIVGGDHSSPAVLKAHSWHPVPILLYAKHVRPDGIAEFGERACAAREPWRAARQGHAADRSGERRAHYQVERLALDRDTQS